LACGLRALSNDAEEEGSALLGLLRPQRERAHGSRAASARLLRDGREVLSAEGVEVAEVIHEAVELRQQMGADEGPAAQSVVGRAGQVRGRLDRAEGAGGEGELFPDGLRPRTERVLDPGDTEGICGPEGLEPTNGCLVLRKRQRACDRRREIGAQKGQQAQDQVGVFPKAGDEAPVCGFNSRGPTEDIEMPPGVGLLLQLGKRVEEVVFAWKVADPASGAEGERHVGLVGNFVDDLAIPLAECGIR
jgi:hypothetical protein